MANICRVKGSQLQSTLIRKSRWGSCQFDASATLEACAHFCHLPAIPWNTCLDDNGRWCATLIRATIGQPNSSTPPVAMLVASTMIHSVATIISKSHCGSVAFLAGSVCRPACRLERNRTTSKISGYWHTSEKPVLEIATSTAQLLTPLLPLFTILPWTKMIALSGGIVSEEALDLSSDRLLMMLNQHSRSPLMSQLTNLCPVTFSRHVHSYRCSAVLLIRTARCSA